MSCSPQAVQDGRRLVARALDDWAGGPEWCDLRRNVLLVVTELLGNAARSCAHMVLLRVDGQDRHVRISVADDSPCRELFRASPDADVTRWSKAIVGFLSESWGETFYDGELREVWCLLGMPVRRALPLAGAS